MATPEPNEEAIKARIVSHMNADHPDSLTLYLDHHYPRPPLLALLFPYPRPQITCILPTSLTIRTSASASTVYTIPIEPPLQSWSEARTRLVAMDVAARAALRRAPVTVTTFVSPFEHRPLLHGTVWVVCLLTLVMLSSRSAVAPGGWAYDGLLKHLPDIPFIPRSVLSLLGLGPGPLLPVALLVQKYRGFGFALMVGLHLLESVFMVRKLHWANVSPFTKVWYMWVGTCFVEGYNSFQRLNGQVEDKVREQEKRKQ